MSIKTSHTRPGEPGLTEAPGHVLTCESPSSVTEKLESTGRSWKQLAVCSVNAGLSFFPPVLVWKSVQGKNWPTCVYLPTFAESQVFCHVYMFGAAS